MLRALVEHGEVPDLVLGCSVGAANGARVSRQDPTVEGVGRLEALWRGLDGKDVFPSGILPTAVQLARPRCVDPRDRRPAPSSRACCGSTASPTSRSRSSAWRRPSTKATEAVVRRRRPRDGDPARRPRCRAVYPPVEIDGVRLHRRRGRQRHPAVAGGGPGADPVFVLHGQLRPAPPSPAGRSTWHCRRTGSPGATASPAISPQRRRRRR